MRRLPPRIDRPPMALALVMAVAGCATVGPKMGEPLVPNRVETRAGPFAVFTNEPIAVDSPGVRCLGELEHDVELTLGIKAPETAAPVEIYVLNDREAFGHFLQFYFPELPPRRAFFLAKGSREVVYAFRNDKLEEDLRHEATHALLHASVGDLPLWLDEGLAEYFETPEAQLGLNQEHLARLPEDARAGWRPDLARLESLKSVAEMTPRDYREAWAWVHYMLNGQPTSKAALLAYLAEVRNSPQAPPLSQRLLSADHEAGRALLAHLEWLRTQPPRATASVAPVLVEHKKVLLQSPTLESVNAPPQRGLFGNWFGLGRLFGRRDN